MTRVKRGPAKLAKRKKVLKAAKGYFGAKSKLYRTAKEQVMRSGNYAYRDRKTKKRDFRKLWIQRINAATREHGMSYSRFINGLTLAGVEINRKMLSEVAINEPADFKVLVELAEKALNGEKIAEAKPKLNEVKAPTKEAIAEKKAPAKAEIKVEKASTKETEETLTKMTVAALTDLAKEREIQGYSGLKKADLIELIINN